MLVKLFEHYVILCSVFGSFTSINIRDFLWQLFWSSLSKFELYMAYRAGIPS